MFLDSITMIHPKHWWLSVNGGAGATPHPRVCVSSQIPGKARLLLTLQMVNDLNLILEWFGRIQVLLHNPEFLKASLGQSLYKFTLTMTQH